MSLHLNVISDHEPNDRYLVSNLDVSYHQLKPSKVGGTSLPPIVMPSTSKKEELGPNTLKSVKLTL